MPAETEWLIVKAVHPASSSTHLPNEVAELIGLHPAELANLRKEQRSLAFLDRGPGALRVITPIASGALYIKELGAHRVVATTSVSQALVVNIPDAVERFLGITTYPLNRPGLTATDESIAWVAPAEEVLAYRKSVREERKFGESGDKAHIYLMKATSNRLLPSLDILEKVRAKASAGLPTARVQIA